MGRSDFPGAAEAQGAWGRCPKAACPQPLPFLAHLCIFLVSFVNEEHLIVLAEKGKNFFGLCIYERFRGGRRAGGFIEGTFSPHRGEHRTRPQPAQESPATFWPGVCLVCKLTTREKIFLEPPHFYSSIAFIILYWEGFFLFFSK